MTYEKNNIFYKIINGEIKTEKILDEKYYIVIHDINPKAPLHVLVIPKGEYSTYDDFISNANESEIIAIQKGIGKVIDMFKLKKGGYKITINNGKFANQEVPHLHIHITGDDPSNQ